MGTDMEGIAEAIRHGAEAGKLRAFVRKNGNSGLPNDGWAGLAGLVRLADRHSAASAAALKAGVDRETQEGRLSPRASLPRFGEPKGASAGLDW